MSQFIPYDGLIWVESTLDGLAGASDTSLQGWAEFTKSTLNIPLLPENSVPPGSKVAMLKATLVPRKRYVIGFENLKQAMASV